MSSEQEAVSNQPEPINTDSTDAPVCPHCGANDYDWWDGIGNKDDGDSWTHNCGSCGQDYKVTMCVSVSFSTEKQ
jgi:hypothetical protein